MQQLPTQYKEWLVRVTSIVDYIFPFEAKAKERFLDWLWKHSIDYDDYMEEASSWGRYIHKAMEIYCVDWEFKGKKYKWYTSSWIEFLKNCAYEVVCAEKYVQCKTEGLEFQGTIDSVVRRKSDGKYWILDFKTYWLAKDKWNLQSAYKKPSSKLKKAALQLSLYAYAEELNIEFIVVVEIWNWYTKEWELAMWDKGEVENIIMNYKSLWC